MLQSVRPLQQYLPILIAVCVYALYQLPTWNVFSGLLDEGYFNHVQQLINQGKVPYRDFFMVTMPGSYYVVAWLTPLLGGEYLLASRLLGAGTALLTLIICSRIFRFPLAEQALYLSCLAMLLAAPARMFTYNDALVGALFALFFTIRGVERGGRGWFVAAGCSAAAAMLFKQSIGGLLIPALVMGIFLTGRHRHAAGKGVLSLAGGVLIILVPILLYFTAVGALRDMVYYTLSFAVEVKSHSTSFLKHRIIAAPFAIFLFWLLKTSPWRVRLLLVGATFVVGAAYVFGDSNRVGRLLTYLPDQVFYVQTVGFLVPLLALSMSLGRRTPTARLVSLTAIVYLVVFLSMGASGYSTGPVVAAAPLGIPLFLYGGQYLARYVPYAQWLMALLIVTFTVIFAWNPLHSSAIVFGSAPISQYTESIPLREATGIRFTHQQAADLTSVITYIRGNTRPHEKIFCFPYCPGLYVLADREGGSYYSLFYFETFMEKDQDVVLADLKKNHVNLVVLQRKGDLDLRAEFENIRLAKLLSQLRHNYPRQVYANSNFVVLAR